jgi:transcriptional antiterminator RfaH
MNNEKNFWYVLKTKSLAEKKVADRLEGIGLESFLPLKTSWRQWSDRKKKVMSPLIPSTVFIRCNESKLKDTFSIQGTNGLLYYLGKPAIVKDFEIDNLKIILKELEGLDVEKTENSIQIGEDVVVTRGPFKGLIASSISLNGKHRIQVNIESIGTNVLLNIPKSFVRKIVDNAA